MTDVLEQTQTIFVTEKALATVRNLLEEKNVPGYGLRVFVAGGGCSGMQYGMALEEEARPYDHVIEHDGVKVFVDPTSMMYLAGATVDYEEGLEGSRFVINNPNATSTCGCGASFSI